MCVNHKVIYGQAIDLCTMKCRGGVGEGVWGTVTKGSPKAVPAHPAKKMVRLQSLDADKVWNLKHFQEKSQQKEKKKKENTSKTRHWNPFSLMSQYFTSYQTVVL